MAPTPQEGTGPARRPVYAFTPARAVQRLVQEACAQSEELTAWHESRGSEATASGSKVNTDHASQDQGRNLDLYA